MGDEYCIACEKKTNLIELEIDMMDILQDDLYLCYDNGKEIERIINDD